MNPLIDSLNKLIEERGKCSARLYQIHENQTNSKKSMVEAIQSIDRTILELGKIIAKPNHDSVNKGDFIPF